MQIFVKTPCGKTIILEVESTYTVGRIMYLIEDKIGIPPIRQRLNLGGFLFRAADAKAALPLAYYNIVKETTLHLQPSYHLQAPLDLRRISVYSTGTTKLYFKLYLFDTATIGMVKFNIQHKEGIPSHQQRLMVAGKELLEDDGTLAQYNLGHAPILDLVLRQSKVSSHPLRRIWRQLPRVGANNLGSKLA